MKQESLYPDVKLFIAGQWAAAADARTLPVVNPATGDVIGNVSHAGRTDMDRALEAARRGFETWRDSSPLERSKVLRGAAALLRTRSEEIARLMTMEQGKPLNEARQEIERGAEQCEWMAGEAQRMYGRTIPGRAANVMQIVMKEPVGPVVAFTPWNFPINQAVRKLAGAVAAGCSIIVKGPEEAPASCAALVRAFADSGAPAGVVNLLYGTPAEISEYLIPHPVIRKISFTGSTTVGKQLASLAGRHMKLVTMELGGHAPVLVLKDADIEAAAKAICGAKFRCTGQTCVSPTRVLVDQTVYAQFTEAFVAEARALRLGDGLEPGTTVGPLANHRRLEAMQAMVADAVERGASLRLGGKRSGERGFFFEPTVLADVPLEARAMNEEPFGPIALLRPFADLDEAISEANRLPFGLSAYLFTRSATTARQVARRIESGMVSVNHFGLGLPETPFGGVKDSGYGYEGGSEAIEAYLQVKLLTMADL